MRCVLRARWRKLSTEFLLLLLPVFLLLEAEALRLLCSGAVTFLGGVAGAEVTTLGGGAWVGIFVAGFATYAKVAMP